MNTRSRRAPFRLSWLGLRAFAFLAVAATPALAAIPGTERTALVALYNGTGGGGWANRDGWLGPAGTECDWRGIACNGSRNAVVGISLGSNRLAGALPAGLANLKQLETLELEDNALTGSIPRQLATLPKLRFLLLGLNQLAGALPKELGTFAQLETLSLPFNRFSGAIPAELGGLAKLKTLDLNRNELTGSIPNQLSALTQLEILDLSGNQLSGSIPGALRALTRLRSLFLGSNRLSGSVPSAFGELVSLVQLGLSENDLTGLLPPALGGAAHLRFLDLRRNHLWGSVPPELSNLVELENLLLSDNRFGGTLPKELGDFPLLSTLWISGNRFVGSVPVELAGPTELADDGGLDLRDNALATDVEPGLLAYLNGKQKGGEWLSSQAPAALFDPGIDLTRLADARSGGFLLWRVEVGSHALPLTVSTSGGAGNADLFLRFGAAPTGELFDASSTGSGNQETIALALPHAGTYYVGLRATAPYSGATLQVAGGGGGCAASATALCLNGGRFKVEAAWRTADGRSGSGHPLALTGDTGTFWFFDAANLEMVVKALNGCGVNGSFWIFAGGLTNVQVDLTVTDTATGTTRTYRNPQGAAFQPIQDTRAFSTCAGAATVEEDPVELERSALAAWGDLEERLEERIDQGLLKAGSCAAGSDHLCLSNNRFRVEATWRSRNGESGVGTAIPLTADTGTFWFFDAGNVEMILKVLNACPVNGRFWVFAGGLTDVETEIRVTDTMTGAVRTYKNPQGTAFAPIQDTGAFSGCP
jgi:Leucine-rich repeat (LRR) protein